MKRLSRDDEKFIINILRQGTIKWKGRREVLNRARRRVLIGSFKNGKPHYKYHWQCATCRKWFEKESEMQVDHIVELGTFHGDWLDYILRMFDRDGQQALCILCHMKKTEAFNSAVTRWKRKPHRGR